MKGHTREETQGKKDRKSSVPLDFKKRLFSAFFLSALLLLALLSDLVFIVLISVISSIVCWEWSQMIRKSPFDTPLLVLIFFVQTAGLIFYFGYHALALFSLAGGFFLLLWMTQKNTPRLFSLGVFYIGLPALSLLWFRQDPSYGMYSALFLFSVVIGTDTSSYIIGRLLGGAKLAPQISPNKTWSGFIGGISIPSVVSYVCLLLGNYPASLFFTTLLLSFSCQIGDLFESLLKRKFHVKDSGSLIPGHGGFLDRIDGLIFASIVAGCLALVINPQSPARSLLFWSYSHD